MLGVWGYLFMYGAPKQTTEIFSNLGIIRQSDTPVRTVASASQPQEEGVQLSLSGSPLQQLSTRAVAGFTFVPDTPNVIRYVEQGTGHVYQIDLQSNLETQISLTTLPQTTVALFSPRTTKVALTVYENYDTRVSVGTLDETKKTLSFFELRRNAENIAFKNENEIYFTLAENNQTVGYVVDLTTQKSKEVLRAPFADSTMLWGNTFAGMYIYPKPAATLEGALYSIAGSQLTPKTTAFAGLTSFTNGVHTVTSRIIDAVYHTESISGTVTYPQGIIMINEKCAFSSEDKNILWCAAPLTATATYLQDWHKGIITSEDYLWYTNLTEESSTLVGDLPKLALKTLDVHNVAISDDGKNLLMGNKIDQTLWLYRIVQ